MKTNNARSLWSRILIILGSIASSFRFQVSGFKFQVWSRILIILPGSLLVALGTGLGSSDRRLIAYRVAVFILIAFGVGAIWGLYSVGGFGGPSGRSMWWGVLILPYLIGWSMGIWGPGSPRWLLVSGIGVGLWYLAILAMVLKHPRPHGGSLPGIIIAVIGVLTIAGCIGRLTKQIPRQS
jgi:hypothetical protein